MNTELKIPELKAKDFIINFLDEQIQKHMEFECMPENDNGYYFVSRSNIGKMVDGLIPLVKEKYKAIPPLPTEYFHLLKQRNDMRGLLNEFLGVLPFISDAILKDSYHKKINKLLESTEVNP